MQWDNPSQPCLYQGSPTAWKAENGKVGIKIDGPGCVTELIPSNFNLTEGLGYSYSFDMEFTGTVVADRNVIFKYLNPSNWYDFKFYGSTIWLQKVVGSYYRLESASYPFQDNQTYHFQIVFSGNSIKLFIYGAKIWELEDSPPYFSGGTIGLQASVGNDPDSEVWFDNVVVTSLEPTPSPTPTPSPLVVVLPGLGMSWNPEAILSCNLNAGGEWTLASYAQSSYQPILNALTNAGVKNKLFAYDWRKIVTDTALVLNDFLKNNLTPGQRANLVGHSLGGLVSRAYLEKVKENHQLNKLLTVGSPHRDAPLAYYPWEGGEIITNDSVQKLAINILIKHCGGLWKTNRQMIQKLSPSIGNLLPLDPYLKDWKTNEVIPIIKMKEKNTWVHDSSFTAPFWGVQFGTLSGTGFKTLKNIEIKPRSKLDILLGNWVDGKPSGKETVTEGDGTVLSQSSQFPDAQNLVIHQDHGGLIASNEGIGKIFEFLGINQPLSLSQSATPESALVIIVYPSETEVTDNQNLSTSDDRGLITILNPQEGKYKITIKPEKETTFMAVGQLIGDNFLWKEYTLKGKGEKRGTIFFSPKSPREDAFTFTP